MQRIKHFLMGLACAAWLTGPALGATINGSVKWKGAVPRMGTINMDKEPACVAKHGGKEAVSDVLVLGTGGTMANVFVYVKSGIPAGSTFQAPETPVVIEQKGCTYIPHVFAVMKGQPFLFKNADGVLHNVHALPDKNRSFNLTMPGTMTDSEPKTFDKREEKMFVVKCDVHPWMKAYAAVMDHPFFAVTSKGGKFSIPNLPAGTYEIEAWHEKAGVKTSKLTVKKADTKAVNFVFSKK